VAFKHHRGTFRTAWPALRCARIPGGNPVPSLGDRVFQAPHGLAVDTRGDFYDEEVSRTNWPQTFKDRPWPDNLRSLYKFRKADSGVRRAKQERAHQGFRHETMSKSRGC
jgi:hypothetical protein